MCSSAGFCRRTRGEILFFYFWGNFRPLVTYADQWLYIDGGQGDLCEPPSPHLPLPLVRWCEAQNFCKFLLCLARVQESARRTAPPLSAHGGYGGRGRVMARHDHRPCVEPPCLVRCGAGSADKGDGGRDCSRVAPDVRQHRHTLSRGDHTLITAIIS